MISGLYFPAFGLDTEIYKVNLRIQSDFPKIRDRKTPNLLIYLNLFIYLFIYLLIYLFIYLFKST